jgi:predicted aspartyl protease
MEKGDFIMGHTKYSADEIVARGKAIYEQRLRAQLEPQNVGKFLVIDIETGDYEMDADDLAASLRAARKAGRSAVWDAHWFGDFGNAWQCVQRNIAVIIGQVTPRNEAEIPVVIRDAAGQAQPLDAIVDTGFSGYLSLQLAKINALQLTFVESRVFSLGDNMPVNFDLYAAVLVWDGQERDILVLASEAHPLVRMSLLKGFRLTINAIDGGEVRIERLP